MPKMKTKSSAKKRFKISATGKVIAGQAGKRDFMSHKKNQRHTHRSLPQIITNGYFRKWNCLKIASSHYTPHPPTLGV